MANRFDETAVVSVNGFSPPSGLVIRLLTSDPKRDLSEGCLGLSLKIESRCGTFSIDMPEFSQGFLEMITVEPIMSVADLKKIRLDCENEKEKILTNALVNVLVGCVRFTFTNVSEEEGGEAVKLTVDFKCGGYRNLNEFRIRSPSSLAVLLGENRKEQKESNDGQ